MRIFFFREPISIFKRSSTKPFWLHSQTFVDHTSKYDIVHSRSNSVLWAHASSRRFYTASVEPKNTRFVSIVQNKEDRILLEKIIKQVVKAEDLIAINTSNIYDSNDLTDCSSKGEFQFRSAEKKVMDSLLPYGVSDVLVDHWRKLVSLWSDKETFEELLLEQRKRESYVIEGDRKITNAVEEHKEDLEYKSLVEEVRSMEEEIIRQLGIIEEKRKNKGIQDSDCRTEIRVEVRPVLGGDEANELAHDMVHLYTSYIQRQGWNYINDSKKEYDKALILPRPIHVKGHLAYSHLQHESGIHKFIRRGIVKVHTATVVVIVLPEAEQIKDDLYEKDLHVEYMQAGGAGGTASRAHSSKVHIIHKPTNIQVACRETRSLLENYNLALGELRTRLREHYQSLQDESVAQKKKEIVGLAETGEKIRTYDFERDRITDHRCNLVVNDVEGFMQDGERLNEFIHPLKNHLLSESAIRLMKRLNRAMKQ